MATNLPITLKFLHLTSNKRSLKMGIWILLSKTSNKANRMVASISYLLKLNGFLGWVLQAVSQRYDGGIMEDLKPTELDKLFQQSSWE
ncbi:unnamed protein product [Debaryomyces tyrocola]|nr:unnamed protein product [Debaryomyces tyrocola]